MLHRCKVNVTFLPNIVIHSKYLGRRLPPQDEHGQSAAIHVSLGSPEGVQAILASAAEAAADFGFSCRSALVGQHKAQTNHELGSPTNQFTTFQM